MDSNLRFFPYFVITFFLLSFATTAPTPDWAQSPAAITQVYPADAYIAQRGWGQTLEAAEDIAVVLAKPMSGKTAHNSCGESGRI
ncbi:hypothetical protein FACS189444_4550 [Spirochaetia bacterium]|nr:hypothetical protein FACS189444_4550 [Spirochaetia bacterium]